MSIDAVLEQLKMQESACWGMSNVFLSNKDAHGLHDMGVEIQAIQKAIKELEKVKAYGLDHM